LTEQKIPIKGPELEGEYTKSAQPTYYLQVLWGLIVLTYHLYKLIKFTLL